MPTLTVFSNIISNISTMELTSGVKEREQKQGTQTAETVKGEALHL